MEWTKETACSFRAMPYMIPCSIIRVVGGVGGGVDVNEFSDHGAQTVQGTSQKGTLSSS